MPILLSFTFEHVKTMWILLHAIFIFKFLFTQGESQYASFSIVANISVNKFLLVEPSVQLLNLTSPLSLAAFVDHCLTSGTDEFNHAGIGALHQVFASEFYQLIKQPTKKLISLNLLEM
jgi:hypothetical protein